MGADTVVRFENRETVGLASASCNSSRFIPACAVNSLYGGSSRGTPAFTGTGSADCPQAPRRVCRRLGGQSEVSRTGLGGRRSGWNRVWGKGSIGTVAANWAPHEFQRSDLTDGRLPDPPSPRSRSNRFAELAGLRFASCLRPAHMWTYRLRVVESMAHGPRGREFPLGGRGGRPLPRPRTVPREGEAHATQVVGTKVPSRNSRRSVLPVFLGSV